MTRRQLVLALCLVVAAWLALFGDKGPASGIAEPVMRASMSSPWPSAIGSAVWPTTAEQSRAEPRPAKQEPVIEALRPRDMLIGGATDGKQAEHLFSSQSWVTPPPLPKPIQPPPPSAPPLPFAYLGKKSENATWEVYLARGEQTFIVHEKTVIDGTYRIDSIKPPSLTLTYLPLNQMQSLTIGGGD